jgi:hypothetical protein
MDAMLSGGQEIVTNAESAQLPLRQSKRRNRPCYIYVLEHAGRIKIGISRDVPARLKEIERHMDHPPKLLGVVGGTYQHERAIHKRLSDHRLKGEWFKDVTEVRALIGTILNHGLAAANLKVQKVKKVEFVPSPPDPMAMPRILAMMWGDNVIAELEALTAEPIDVIQGWLDLTIPVPRLVRLALAAALTSWMTTDTCVSFREGRPGYWA